MDRELSEAVIRKQKTKKGIGGFLLLLIIFLAWYLMRLFIVPSLAGSGIRTAVAEMGNIENTIAASGEVIPAYEQVIVSPIRAEIKKLLLPIGTRVVPNQAILELNKEFALLQEEKLQDQLALKENSMVQLRLALDKNLYDLEISNEKKDLQISGLKADLEDAKRLSAIGGGTAEAIEKIQLNLQIAELEKKQLENDLKYKQQSVASDLKELSLQTSIQSKELKEFSRKLEQAAILSNRKGVLTWVNENIGTTVSEGEALAKIADLGQFRIEGAISDIYSDRIKINQAVFIRINEVDLSGQISNIKPAIQDGIIQFDIQLDEAGHELLRPNLKVEVFLITQSKKQTLRVANGPVFNGRKQQFIYVLENGKAKRRLVNIGLSNFDYVEILDNLKVGEQVIITDMKAYEHLEEVVIK
jgi:HlyD family secretion protein